MTFTVQALHFDSNTKHKRTIEACCLNDLLVKLNDWNKANFGKWFYWY